MKSCIYPPPRPKYKRVIALPSSNFSNLSEPARTFHIAMLARTLGIFRVEEVVIYRHEGVSCSYVEDVLRALETPQYLRKKLTPIKKSLRFLGLVPPISLPSHQLKDDNFPLREGLVIARKGEFLLVDIGLEKPIKVKGEVYVGERVTLKRDKGEWILADPEQVEVYWKYSVKCFPNLSNTVDEFRRRNFLVIATSRKGEPSNFKLLYSIFEEMKSREANGLLIIFGSWKKGLYEIARDEGRELSTLADYVLNTVPCQGTRTVRTEEAVLATLSIINVLID